MKITKFNGGWRILVPAGEHNSEFVYFVPINDDGPLAISYEQRRIARRLAVLLHSMEGFFKRWRKPEDFDEWEAKNRLDWNEWFHDQAAELEDRAYALFREYCDWHWDKFGWNAY